MNDIEYKKKINEKINNIKDTQTYYKIFNIIKDELYIDNKKKFTQNNNGIFFDLNILSDVCLKQIDDLI